MNTINNGDYQKAVEDLINMIPFAEKTVSILEWVLNKENQQLWYDYNDMVMKQNYLQRNSTEKNNYKQASILRDGASKRIKALFFMKQDNNHNKTCTCHH